MPDPKPTNRAQRRHPDALRRHPDALRRYPDALRRQLITINEAAEYLGVTERTIRTKIANGLLRAYRLNPHFIRLDLNEINEALKPIGGAADAS